ncbi:helix-hairpin-helix protein [Chitinophaga skermanii]|uniref:Helix-hairpin-helix protein n=1 Tax=Chitinophaga skermanii TaxID=331697 RepID=A0A327R2G4_9BACT|nr:helix-hairpin-helix domain-containing protein [Chitinophaga skermanii]RAJ11006.1 helix-hairpin-helix protein [Chitinophaga skermanii]
MAIKSITCLLWCVISIQLFAQQQETWQSELQLEAQAVQEDAQENEDQQYQLRHWQRKPLQLNTATAEDLAALGCLHPLQIAAILSYRTLLGDFISIYELQAVPGLDLLTIRQMLPYIVVGRDMAMKFSIQQILTGGDHTFRLRLGSVLEKARGFKIRDTLGKQYVGDRMKVLLRYKYQFGQQASWGFLVEKDAGERYWSKYGVDFSSFHFMLAHQKHVKKLILGDYVVNLGQGLIQWHSMAYSMGNDAMLIKKDNEVIRPYTSAGEYYFYRGAAITFEVPKTMVTAFVSRRRLDAIMNEDSLLQANASIQSSGYHRTALEIARMQQFTQYTAGGQIRWSKQQSKLNLNVIHHHFSSNIKRGDALYQVLSFTGKAATNISTDYSLNWRNMHLFGEIAYELGKGWASVQGALASLHKDVDISILYRYYNKQYHGRYARAFGQQSNVTNEIGVYTGFQWRFNREVQLSAFIDVYKFPWLKYLVPAPSSGVSASVTLQYTPSKQTSCFLRYTSQHAEEQVIVPGKHAYNLVGKQVQVARCQVVHKLSELGQMKVRYESKWYRSTTQQTGWMLYCEWQQRIPRSTVKIRSRLTRFDVGGSDSRMYVVTGNQLFDQSIMQYSGEGWQYYVYLDYKLARKLQITGSIQHLHIPGRTSLGSGWDEIEGPRSTQCMIQCTWGL